MKTLKLADGVSIAKGSAQGEAKWNKIFAKGEQHRADFPDGEMSPGPEQFAQMISNWKRAGGNALPVDRHHWGDSNDTRVRAEDKIAVGWIEDLRVGPDGDLEALINWNADGREDIEKDRRRYISATFHPNWTDRKTGKPQGWTLFGAGLLNDPYQTELPRMAASRDSTTADPATNPEKKMNKHLLAALALIGLTESSTEADVTAKQKELEAEKLKLGQLVTEKETAIKLAATRGDGLEALKTQLSNQQNEIKAMKDASRDAEINAFNEQLLREGRITAAEQADVTKVALAMGLPEAKSIFSKRAPIVKFKATGISSGGEGNDGDALVKLKKIADEIETKEKVKPSQAMRMAASRNPDLYKASLTEGTATRAAADA